MGLIALGAVDRYPVGDTQHRAMLAITDGSSGNSGSSGNNEEVNEREGRSYIVDVWTV